jgi:RNA polymerase sigma factor (sigma-70 family)
MQGERTPVDARGLADESDADLMVYMTMAGEAPETARAAWEVFYRRHAEYLYAVSMRAYWELLGGEAGVCDLVADTFKRAYENAERFDADGVVDPERLRLRVRAWLGRIAQRLVQDRLRQHYRAPTRFLAPDEWQQMAEPAARACADSVQLERVRRAILSLSKREQMVVRVTLQWYQPDKAHQRLPNEVAAELAATLGTTPENIRQIRKRAMGKIEAHLRRDPAGKGVGDDCDESESPRQWARSLRRRGR